jgi:hypothetical protein
MSSFSNQVNEQWFTPCFSSILNNAAKNKVVKYLFNLLLLILSGKYILLKCVFIHLESKFNNPWHMLCGYRKYILSGHTLIHYGYLLILTKWWPILMVLLNFFFLVFVKNFYYCISYWIWCTGSSTSADLRSPGKPSG